MKMKKINLEELGQSLSRSEMKEVMAGSGGDCTPGSWTVGRHSEANGLPHNCDHCVRTHNQAYSNQCNICCIV